MSSGKNYPRDYPGWVEENHREFRPIDISHALRAIPKSVRRRVVEDGRRRYVAFDANALCSENELGRPGHLFE